MTISKVALVALYARVSTVDKDQNPENQLMILREYVKNRGLEIYGEPYVDQVSGSWTSRPALDAMLKDARMRRFKAIVAVRQDRIGRSAAYLVNLAQELKDLNIGLIFATQNIDTTTIEGRAWFTIGAAFAEMELEYIRERTKEGLARARAQGIVLGRPQSAIPTQRILDLHSQGFSLNKIGKEVGMTPQGVKKRLIKAGVTKRPENQA